MNNIFYYEMKSISRRSFLVGVRFLFEAKSTPTAAANDDDDDLYKWEGQYPGTRRLERSIEPQTLIKKSFWMD